MNGKYNKQYIILGLDERDFWGESMYWSNKNGWTSSIVDAEKYPEPSEQGKCLVEEIMHGIYIQVGP